MTLRPTEEEEEAKAENAKGIEKGGVQQNGLQNGQDGAANQKVSCCRKMSLLLLCHQAHTLRLLLQNSAGQAAKQADCIGQSKNQHVTVLLVLVLVDAPCRASSRLGRVMVSVRLPVRA